MKFLQHLKAEKYFNYCADGRRIFSLQFLFLFAMWNMISIDQINLCDFFVMEKKQSLDDICLHEFVDYDDILEMQEAVVDEMLVE